MFFDEIEREIFSKYKNALIAIGVDLSNFDVVERLENCSYDMEARFQAIIAYWYWLETQDREMIDPNQLLINAFDRQWKPIGWKEEFIDNKEFISPAKKWWNEARNVEFLKSLVVDVKDNFWMGGKVIFQYPDGELWTLDLERAMDMSWSEIISHYQRVTSRRIESHPGRFVLREERNLS